MRFVAGIFPVFSNVIVYVKMSPVVACCALTAFKESTFASEICVKAGFEVIVREMIGAVGSAIKV
ncbi:hypothetical protein BACERE00175_01764 [Bacillus cereus]|nr:hypothetical protein BACERE00175_01764 [Bacillus cereus]